ncbi:MAG: 3-hydroxyacyl-CoA dehydrogenase family protein [Betaproteobacteria bacterium]|nr:3-hydroxyacyl-CoA dehydrogenase family protein [Betaproteobacteria bacterium]
MSDAPNAVPERIARVAVVGGAGSMGHGIVIACLLGSPDADVRLVARRRESLDHGLELVRSGPFGLDGAVRKGRIDAATRDRALARLKPTLDLAEGVRDAQIVFESVPEIVDRKVDVLREIEASAPRDAVIASGTSSIMIGELGRALAHVDRLVGTHWFYPSNVMPLVEVARADRSAPWATERIVSYLAAIGKKPVVVRDSPGFFMTRFVNLFAAEAMRAVQEGICGIRDVDEMCKTGLGWPMGVFELLDKTASFDAWYHAQEYLHETLGERTRFRRSRARCSRPATAGR